MYENSQLKTDRTIYAQKQSVVNNKLKITLIQQCKNSVKKNNFSNIFLNVQATALAIVLGKSFLGRGALNFNKARAVLLQLPGCNILLRLFLLSDILKPALSRDKHLL